MHVSKVLLWLAIWNSSRTLIMKNHILFNDLDVFMQPSVVFIEQFIYHYG